MGSYTRGNGVSYPHIRTGGDSRRAKQRLVIVAVTSAPKPLVMGASWLTNNLPVLLTDSSAAQTFQCLIAIYFILLLLPAACKAD